MISEFIQWLRKPEKSFFEWLAELIFVFIPLIFLIRTFVFGLYVVPSGSMETTMLIGERYFANKGRVALRRLLGRPRAQRGEIISFNQPTYAYSSGSCQRLFECYVYGPSNWTKRVIGVPGDHVKGVIEHGKPIVYLNGEILHEPYLNQLPLIDLWKGNIPTEQDFYNGTVCEDIRSFDPAKSFADQTLYTLDPALRVTEQQVNVSFLTQRGFVYDATLDAYVLPADKPLANGGDEFDVVLGPREYWVMGDNRKGSDDSRRWGPLREELIHGIIEWRFFSLQYTKPWSFWYFDESWAICDLLLHPFSFFKRVRWDRCLGSMRYVAS